MNLLLKILEKTCDFLTDYSARYNIPETPKINKIFINRYPRVSENIGKISSIKLCRKKSARYTTGEIYFFADFVEIIE